MAWEQGEGGGGLLGSVTLKENEKCLQKRKIREEGMPPSSHLIITP